MLLLAEKFSKEQPKRSFAFLSRRLRTARTVSHIWSKGNKTKRIGSFNERQERNTKGFFFRHTPTHPKHTMISHILPLTRRKKSGRGKKDKKKNKIRKNAHVSKISRQCGASLRARDT